MAGECGVSKPYLSPALLLGSREMPWDILSGISNKMLRNQDTTKIASMVACTQNTDALTEQAEVIMRQANTIRMLKQALQLRVETIGKQDMEREKTVQIIEHALHFLTATPSCPELAILALDSVVAVTSERFLVAVRSLVVCKCSYDVGVSRVTVAPGVFFYARCNGAPKKARPSPADRTLGPDSHGGETSGQFQPQRPCIGQQVCSRRCSCNGYTNSVACAASGDRQIRTPAHIHVGSEGGDGTDPKQSRERHTESWQKYV